MQFRFILFVMLGLVGLATMSSITLMSLLLVRDESSALMWTVILLACAMIGSAGAGYLLGHQDLKTEERFKQDRRPRPLARVLRLIRKESHGSKS